MFDNVTTRANGENSELRLILTSIGPDNVIFTNYSHELGPIELAFNVMTQRFKSRYHESMFNADKDALDVPRQVINLITPGIIVSCFQKYGYGNFLWCSIDARNLRVHRENHIKLSNRLVCKLELNLNEIIKNNKICEANKKSNNTLNSK